MTFRAPYVESTPDNMYNGTQILLQIKEARYTSVDGTEYDPAPSRTVLITVYPEGAKFLSVKMSTESDVIDPDVNPDGTFGFTIVKVFVEEQTGLPAVGVTVYAEVSPAIPELAPASAITDTNGMAEFTLTATDFPDNDGSTQEFLVIAKAVSPDPTVNDGTQSLHIYIVDAAPPPPPPEMDSGLVMALVFIAVIAVAVAVAIIFLRKP